MLLRRYFIYMGVAVHARAVEIDERAPPTRPLPMVGSRPVGLPRSCSPSRTSELSVPVVTAELRLDLLVKINSELPGQNGSRNDDFGKISAKIIGSAVA